jgi:hypothetical protein
MNNETKQAMIWCVQGGWDYEGMDDEIRLFTSEAVARQWEQRLQERRMYDRIEVWQQRVLDECPEDNGPEDND